MDAIPEQVDDVLPPPLEPEQLTVTVPDLLLPETGPILDESGPAEADLPSPLIPQRVQTPVAMVDPNLSLIDLGSDDEDHLLDDTVLPSRALPR